MNFTDSDIFTSSVDRKFSKTGCPITFKGNTFLGHLEQQGKGYNSFNRILDVYRQLPDTSFYHKLAVLPPSSYHVTLFIGLNECDRESGVWAKNLTRNTPFNVIDEQFILKLKNRLKEPLLDCKFVVDLNANLPSNTGNLFIPLKPSDNNNHKRLQLVRDELSELLQIKREDHNNYQYHISLGYLFKKLNNIELEEYHKKNIEWREYISQVGEIIIPTFHFCTLNDMHSFKTICQV